MSGGIRALTRLSFFERFESVDGKSGGGDFDFIGWFDGLLEVVAKKLRNVVDDLHGSLVPFS